MLGRGLTAAEEQSDTNTPQRRTLDRIERKDRSWVKADAKDPTEGDATIMGRFAMKGALKLQTGDEVRLRPGIMISKDGLANSKLCRAIEELRGKVTVGSLGSIDRTITVQEGLLTLPGGGRLAATSTGRPVYPLDAMVTTMSITFQNG